MSPISVEQRRNRLLEMLQVRGFASLPELSTQLEVSESTVRRDLDFLEENGAAKRTHGGVYYTGSSPKLPHFDQRQATNLDKKQEIGQAAGGRIEDVYNSLRQLRRSEEEEAPAVVVLDVSAPEAGNVVVSDLTLDAGRMAIAEAVTNIACAVPTDAPEGGLEPISYVPADSLAGRLQAKGRLVLDAGASRVLRESGSSLLAVGVREVHGEFRRGEMVACIDDRGREFARGLVNYSSDETRRIQGRASGDIAQVLGYVDDEELIHRDNLVLI